MNDPFDQLEPAGKRKVGRPSMYSQEVADRYINYLYDGYGVREIARLDGMPTHTTVTRWLAAYPEFSVLYKEARKLQLDLMAEDILEIADNGGMNVPLARLRTDVRKWLLSKLVRETYGNTVKLEVAQAKPDSDLDLTKLSDEQLQQYLELLEKAKADGDAE